MSTYTLTSNINEFNFNFDFIQNHLKYTAFELNGNYDAIHHWNNALKKLSDNGCILHSVYIQGDSNHVRSNGSVGCNGMPTKRFINIFRDLENYGVKEIIVDYLTMDTRAFSFMMKFICGYRSLEKLTIDNIRIHEYSKDPVCIEDFRYIGPVKEVFLNMHKDTSHNEAEYISKVILNKSLEQSLEILRIGPEFDMHIDTRNIKDLTYILKTNSGCEYTNRDLRKFECLKQVFIGSCYHDADFTYLLCSPNLNNVSFDNCSSRTVTSFLTECAENGRCIEKLSLISIDFDKHDYYYLIYLLVGQKFSIHELFIDYVRIIYNTGDTNWIEYIPYDQIVRTNGLKKLTLRGHGPLFLYTESSNKLEYLDISGYSSPGLINGVCALLSNKDNHLKTLKLPELRLRSSMLPFIDELDAQYCKLEKLVISVPVFLDFIGDFENILTKIFDMKNLTSLEIDMGHIDKINNMHAPVEYIVFDYDSDSDSDSEYFKIKDKKLEHTRLLLNFVKKSKLKKLNIIESDITTDMVKDTVSNTRLTKFNFKGNVKNYTNDFILNVLNVHNTIHNFIIDDRKSDGTFVLMASNIATIENNMRRDLVRMLLLVNGVSKIKKGINDLDNIQNEDEVLNALKIVANVPLSVVSVISKFIIGE